MPPNFIELLFLAYIATTTEIIHKQTHKREEAKEEEVLSIKTIKMKNKHTNRY